MTKIALKIEDLAVESFATGDAEAQRGTVHGAGVGGTTPCQPETVDGCPSPLCPPSSWETCDSPECW